MIRLWFSGWLLLVASATLPASGAEAGRRAISQILTDQQRRVAMALAQGDGRSQVIARLELAAIYQELGHYCSATEELEPAWAIAEQTQDPRLMLRARLALGALDVRARRLARAQTLLDEALPEARALGDRAAEARILAALATLALSREPSSQESAPPTSRAFKLPIGTPPRLVLEEGRARFREAAGAARAAGDVALQAGILLDAARAFLVRADTNVAYESASEAYDLLLGRDEALATPSLLVACGRVFAALGTGATNGDARLIGKASEACEEGMRRAASEDWRTRSYGWGCLGAIRLQHRDFAGAMELTLRALDAARMAELDEARFAWTWQAARIQRQAGASLAAEETYQQAVDLLQPLRGDFRSVQVPWGGGPLVVDTVERIYYERTDLLLRRAREAATPELRQSSLTEARRNLELWRASQLDDYYLEEECAGLIRAKEDSLSRVSPGTAVIYLVPLEDRTELLIRLPSGLHSVAVEVPGIAVKDAARELRGRLVNREAADKPSASRHLYDWLVRPLLPGLIKERVHTLVFVPDSDLAEIPPAAFLGSEGYLVEKFALAVSPGLSLMKAEPLRREGLRPLLCGVSKAIGGFSGLPGARDELLAIQELTRSRLCLLDEMFTTNAFARELQRGRYSVVHIASHGHFGGDANQTYLLTAGGGLLTMDLLEQLILPRMLSPRPIELLVLSACETAAGDRRAAFGLAGVAVKSGARTAVASLWQVHDASTGELMVEFYRELHNNPRQSRAQALQQAQRHLLRDERYRDPFFWAPFIMVGQWDDSPPASVHESLGSP